jgi:hypothetical protein
MRAATLGLLAIAAVLAGCASEVDKCMAAWEDANKNVPDDALPRYGRYSSSTKAEFTKAQQRFMVRVQCMEAAKGGSE